MPSTHTGSTLRFSLRTILGPGSWIYCATPPLHHSRYASTLSNSCLYGIRTCYLRRSFRITLQGAAKKETIYLLLATNSNEHWPTGMGSVNARLSWDQWWPFYLCSLTCRSIYKCTSGNDHSSGTHSASSDDTRPTKKKN